MHQSYHTSKAYHRDHRAPQWAEVVDGLLCRGSNYHFVAVLAGATVLGGIVMATLPLGNHGEFSSQHYQGYGLLRPEAYGRGRDRAENVSHGIVSRGVPRATDARNVPAFTVSRGG